MSKMNLNHHHILRLKNGYNLIQYRRHYILCILRLQSLKHYRKVSSAHCYTQQHLSNNYAHDEKDLGNRNLFLATVNTVLKAIRSAYPEVNTTIGHLIAGLEHYKGPANKRVNSVKTKPLDDLKVELEMYEKKAQAEVDGPGMEPNMSSKVKLYLGS